MPLKKACEMEYTKFRFKRLFFFFFFFPPDGEFERLSLSLSLSLSLPPPPPSLSDTQLFVGPLSDGQLRDGRCAIQGKQPDKFPMNTLISPIMLSHFHCKIRFFLPPPPSLHPTPLRPPHPARLSSFVHLLLSAIILCPFTIYVLLLLLSFSLSMSPRTHLHVVGVLRFMSLT